MEMLATVFQGLLDLGAAVFLPIVLFIIGLIVGMKPGKAFSSALTLGVAFIDWVYGGYRRGCFHNNR